ncbi:MAG: DUF1501 domain-containing protein [Rhodothermales bacterium]|nr:DUF1501 domain-containing protein [Rhodothermales bacterium]
MCKHHNHTGRKGSALSDGQAHEHDHQTWSRRDFLANVGLTAAAGTIGLSGLPIRAFARTTMLQELASVETDRVLVILQLSGGNDGLNTVIPYRNDLYFNARPNLAINDSIAISGDYGLHPNMGGMASMFGEGNVGIIHTVGYPEADLSHFRSTDIWMTAGDGNDVPTTGWAGRYLDNEFPEYAEAPTSYPLAVQLGGGAPLMFQGPASQMGMSVQSMELFDRIATSAELYTTDNLPATRLGGEMAFLRSVANDSYLFAEAIQDASSAGSNAAEYATPNPLADQLAAVARLIRGGLGSRIYHVSLGGFDTHAGQAGTHATLLRYISEAVSSFMADLSTDGWADRTAVMSFSEFGRRVGQNGSQGTDHGTAAPLFLFGPSIKGGFQGTEPDLANLVNGNLAFGTDFRSVYASVLTSWFGLAPATTAGILGGAFPTLDLFEAGVGTSTANQTSLPSVVQIDAAYPNPAANQVNITFSVDRATPGRLELFDMLGRRVHAADLGTMAPGSTSVRVPTTGYAPGTYVARLTAGQRTASSTLVIAR